MPISVRWYDKAQSIVMAEMSDPWTLAEMKVQLDILADMHASVARKIVLISDLTQTDSTPHLELAVTRDISGHPALSTRCLEINYIIGMSLPLQTTLNVLRRVFPARFKVLRQVDSLQEALDDLNQRQLTPTPQPDRM